MKLADLDLSKMYTYADYFTWSFDERVELINGEVFEMGPTPATAHQRLSSFLFFSMYSFLRDKPCEVFPAPFDVRFPRKSNQDEDILTVLQPDICVICDPSKIDERGCVGAPDIVVEILSPANHKKELKHKYQVYEEAGVKEYWVVDPAEKSLQVYLLTNGVFLASRPLFEDDKLVSQTLPGFSLDMTDLFGAM